MRYPLTFHVTAGALGANLLLNLVGARMLAMAVLIIALMVVAGALLAEVIHG
jgi:hypothetical protein